MLEYFWRTSPYSSTQSRFTLNADEQSGRQPPTTLHGRLVELGSGSKDTGKVVFSNSCGLDEVRDSIPYLCFELIGQDLKWLKNEGLQTNVSRNKTF